MFYNILLIYTFSILCVAKAFLFEKAGEYGWKALIPLYDLYVMAKIVRKQKTIIYMYLSMLILGISTFVGLLTMNSNVLISNIFFVVLIISMIIFILLYFSVLTAVCSIFDLTPVFAAGLFLLPPVFFGIIAFNDNIRLRE